MNIVTTVTKFIKYTHIILVLISELMSMKNNKFGRSDSVQT